MSSQTPQQDLPPPSNLTQEGEFNKYTTSSRAEKFLVDRFFTSLEGALPPITVQRALEIGVGEGHVSERVAARYPDADLVGIDLPHDDLAERWDRRGVFGVFADAVRLPFPDGAFDLVLAIEVLEHLPDPDGALVELARTCRGHAVFSVPREPLWRAGNMARGRYLKAWGNTPDHIQHWGRRSFVRLVNRHFDVLAARSPLPWTLVVARSRPDTKPSS